MLGKDEVDRLLAGLGAAYDRIAAGMYAIDVHPGLRFLRAGTHTGTTSERWQSLEPEVDVLWAHFVVLGDLLETVRGLRGRHRPGDDEWTRLHQLLTAPVVGLDAAGLPTDGTRPAVSHETLGQLATRLERNSATVTTHLSEVDSAWSAVAARLAPLSESVDEVVALAAGLGEPALTAPLSEHLALAQRLDLGDPLRAAPGGRLAGAAAQRLATLADEVTDVGVRLRELAVVRDGYPQRIEELGALVDQVAQAEAEVARIQARVIEKIADPGLDPVPAAAPVLRARLVDLAELGRRGEWHTLVADLATTGESARQAVHRATRARELAEGLLDRRAELRGRLAAYRAKAARHGLVEDAVLTARYARAHTLLFTAPCDLRDSTRAVYEYQRTLAETLAQVGRNVDG